ncbi:MAG TPA: hypothetical protein VIH43_02385 [Chthoniobacterales bacterium]
MKHVILNREFGVVRTVAVFGPGRGGTSVIAGCLRALGVCMGTSLHPYKHEWSPILRRPDGSVDLPATQQTIEQMNTSYPWWGWKFPSDVFHFEAVMPLLRHPGFIVVTRDLTKIALSSLARQDVPFEISLYEAAKVARYIADRMRFWPFPTLVVPFAETLQRPNALVEILCAFLQIDPDEEKRKQAADFVQPLTQGYRPFDAKPDQLHDFSPAKDNLMDSQLLAVDFSTRYSKEYLQHFERLLPQAKAETNQLAVRIKSAQQLQIASEILNELRDLFASCGVVQLRIDKAEFISAKEWRVTVDKALDRITVVAQKASQEARHSTGNYDGVNRLYCALLLLIRVRTALAAGAHRLTLPQA